MDNTVSKTGEGVSQHEHRTEDVEQLKHQGQNTARGADRAANLIGDQQIELTEEDVSPAAFTH